MANQWKPVNFFQSLVPILPYLLGFWLIEWRSFRRLKLAKDLKQAFGRQSLIIGLRLHVANIYVLVASAYFWAAFGRKLNADERDLIVALGSFMVIGDLLTESGYTVKHLLSVLLNQTNDCAESYLKILKRIAGHIRRLATPETHPNLYTSLLAAAQAQEKAEAAQNSEENAAKATELSYWKATVSVRVFAFALQEDMPEELLEVRECFVRFGQAADDLIDRYRDKRAGIKTTMNSTNSPRTELRSRYKEFVTAAKKNLGSGRFPYIFMAMCNYFFALTADIVHTITVKDI